MWYCESKLKCSNFWTMNIFTPLKIIRNRAQAAPEKTEIQEPMSEPESGLEVYPISSTLEESVGPEVYPLSSTLEETDLLGLSPTLDESSEIPHYPSGLSDEPVAVISSDSVNFTSSVISGSRPSGSGQFLSAGVSAEIWPESNLSSGPGEENIVTQFDEESEETY